MKKNEPDKKIIDFIARLENLTAGDKAMLRRCSGSSLSESRHSMLLFYQLLPYGIPSFQEDIFFLVATIYPLADSGGSGDLGFAMKNARTDKNAKGLDRRMEILLDADKEQLRFRIRQAVRVLFSARIKINWVYLLDDLLQWEHPARITQKAWARSYYGLSVSENN